MEQPKPFNLLNTVNEIIDKGRKNGILQLYTEDESYNGRIITLNHKKLINFGACSYLGLETDPRLKQAAIEAINKYGIQYSSSRTYVSTTLYKELEDLIGKIFDAPILLASTTTLGHQAVIPVIVEEGDVIVLDQNVHASVQYAAQHMQLKGVTVTVIRHNNKEELEAVINKYAKSCNKIWYMADGVYSMYGDYAPIEQLIQILDTHPKLHLYIDDAHGMSWTGKNGRGFVLGTVELHTKMIVASSMAKAFGCGGAVFVFKDDKICQKVKNCGGPLIFSGPNQIPVIAASIASAKIHLSDEIYEMQAALRERILYCHNLLIKYNLPVVSNPETPIKFIGLGLTRVGYNLVKRMMNDGFYCNLAIFPAVSETCTGLRFTINLHQTLKDIENLVLALARNLPIALAEEGRTEADIQRAFKKLANFKYVVSSKNNSLLNTKTKYKIQYETSIEKISKQHWDALLTNGTFDWNWLLFLEQTFKNNAKEEHNWKFHYYIIWDDDKPVLATFFTSALNKDDMLLQEAISYELEVKRIEDPYYLCSKIFMMGSLITEGQHLYVDRSRNDWKEIIMLLLDNIWSEQTRQKANSLCLRDFPAEDIEIQDFFTDQGFIKINLPDNHIIDKVAWNTPETFINQFNARKKWYMNDNVYKYSSSFDVEIVKNFTEEDVNKWYELYCNVKARNFELNTFDLPTKFFAEMAENKNCEVIQLRLKSSNLKGKVVAVTFNMITASNNYCGIIIGFDYDFIKTVNVYKQALFQSLIRAGLLKAHKIFLGFTASKLKQKFGAKAKPQMAFIQIKDSFNMTVINSISNKSLVTENGVKRKLILDKTKKND